MRIKLTTRQVTLTAVFAAVSLVLRVIPTFQMIGVSGHFTAGDFIITAIPLTLDFWCGALAVLIGTVGAYSVNPPVFFGLDFLPALVNVMIAGLILSNHRRLSLVVYGVVMLAFLASPYSLTFAYGYIPYAWLHLVAFMILLSPAIAKVPIWLKEGGFKQLLSIVELSFVGTMAQHLTGGLLYEFTVGVVGGVEPLSLQALWRVIFWIYPIERILLVVFGTVIAISIYRATQRLSLVPGRNHVG
jgi:hypothetical protein